jgi:hypothetical protein
MRNATYRPGRSVLCITLIAAAAFIIIAVDAFRRDDSAAAHDRKSGGGGYALLAESLLPVVHDPNTPEGRDALNLGGAGDGDGAADALEGVTLARFRLRPGDDASCLNLYRPSQPRILAPTEAFAREGRFDCQSSLASEGEAKANPWLLLEREFEDGAVPFIADSTSAAYVLHLNLGEDFLLERGGAAPLRLRLVATLADSIFQGELLVSEQNFLRHFPEQEGFRVFLLELPDRRGEQRVAAALEERLRDFGFDVSSTSERLAGSASRMRRRTTSETWSLSKRSRLPLWGSSRRWLARSPCSSRSTRDASGARMAVHCCPASRWRSRTGTSSR